MNLRYKKGLARLVDFDEERQKLVKLWFSVKIWKVIDKFDALINIDESSFSRLTKNNYSWIPKGKEQIIKNISFRNSCSLVTAIISTGGVIAAKSLVSVASNMFIEFMTEMAKFIQEKEGKKKELSSNTRQCFYTSIRNGPRKSENCWLQCSFYPTVYSRNGTNRTLFLKAQEDCNQ